MVAVSPPASPKRDAGYDVFVSLPNSTGLFVVLEGGEGSGKTTISAALLSALQSAGHDVLATREPGGTPEGTALRALLLAADGYDWDAGAELLLVVAARIQHVKRVIEPALAAGRWVLCDRFVGSTLAYQGAGRGLPADMILDLHERLVGGLRADLTLYLDIDPRIGLARSLRRLGQDGQDEGRFEALDLAFHERVRAAFLAQAKHDCGRSIVIDAARSLAEVQAEVIGAVTTWLAARRQGSPE
jgi:dTMP kinase